MRLGPIGDLIAHASPELKAPAVTKLRIERPLETQKDVSFLAPVVRAIAGRIFDHADANRAELTGAPTGSAGFARMLSRCDRRPVGRTKWEIGDLHGRSGGSRWLNVAESREVLAIDVCSVQRRSKNPRPSNIAGIALSIRAVRVADCFAAAKW